MKPRQKTPTAIKRPWEFFSSNWSGRLLTRLPRFFEGAGADAEHAEKTFGVAVVKVANGLHRSGVFAVERVRCVGGGVESGVSFVERNGNCAGGQAVEVLDKFPTGLGGCIEPIALIDLLGNIGADRFVDAARAAIEHQL